MNFLTPLAFAGALLGIPIILMYMLRLRRREITISSTFLWRQVLQDREANTPWQRLRRNLLLFLQLVILALMVLALARPFITVPAVSAGQVTLLLDASASMNATDINGTSRFEQAKKEALDIINTLSAGDRLTVIRVAELPEALVSRSQDRDMSRAAIRNTQPSLTEPDWQAALNLAAVGGAEAEDFTVVIISDGGLPDDVGLPGIKGEVRYIPVGQSRQNVALTALATRARPGENPELYAQITNYGQSDARMIFTLYADGQRIDGDTMDVPAGETQSFVRPMPEPFRTLRATLTQPLDPPAPDYLAVDNAAYAIGNDTRSRTVLLVTDGNRFLEQALRSLPGLDVTLGDVAGWPPDKSYDLYVLDNFIPSELPDGDLLFINPPQGVPGMFSLGEEISLIPETTTSGTAAATPEAINLPDVTLLPNDPRTQFLDWGPIVVWRFTQVLNADWAQAVIDSDGGPLLLAGEVDGRQVAVLPFDPVQGSNLWGDIAWPILMANLTDWFTPNIAISVTDSLSVGDSLLIRPPFEADSVRVTLPDGTIENLSVERESVVFAGTNLPGIYTIDLLRGEEVLETQSVAVNLFSKLESQIAPVPLGELHLQGTDITQVDEGEELGQREFWPLVILLALAVLFLEWVAYHRRMRVPTVFAPIRGRTQGRVSAAG